MISSLIIGSQNIYANEAKDTVNNIRGAVGTAEDTVENAARDTAGAIREGFNTAGEATQNMIDDAKNGMDNNMNDDRNNDNDGIAGYGVDNGDGYTAQRTSADAITGTGWTWVVLALIGIAIVALVWYYVRQDQTVDRK